MVNKFFALASLTALTGVVVAAASTTAGCSSTEVINVPFDSGVRDATVDRKLGDNEEPPVLTCMVAGKLDATTVDYKPARVIPGACTEASIKTIEDLVASKPDGVPFSDVKTALQQQSATCAACVFAEETDHWAPVVEKSGKVFMNLGGCIEIVSGNVNCGKAWHQFDTCTNFGCQDCTSDSDLNQCYSDIIAAGAPCADAADNLRTVCGSGLRDYLNACYPDNQLTIVGPIRYQCINGNPDGGTKDAGKD
jgi:hypothetical protein